MVTALLAPQSETGAAAAVSPGSPANENRIGETIVLDAVLNNWPIGAISVGLLASVAWSTGLLYGAYLLAVSALR